MNSQPDFELALAKQTHRKATARISSLIRREQAKHPLFADIFIEEEMASKPDYYAAIPDEFDRQSLAFKIAVKNDPNADIDNYIQTDYSMSGIEFSYSAMNFRQLAQNRLHPLEFLKAVAIEFYGKPNARAKGRGRTKPGETGQSVTPRPLERRVGRRTRKEWLLLLAFRS